MKNLSKGETKSDMLAMLVRFIFIFTFLSVSVHAVERKKEMQPSNKCPGYRYVYMVNVSPESEKDERVEFYACKQIAEPSSRPVQCEKIGSISVEKIKETAYIEAEKLWEYKGGILAGAGCSVFAYSAAFANYRLGAAFAAYNLPIDELETKGLRDEVKSKKRELGELPSIESKYTRAIPEICLKLTHLSTSKEKSNFNKGVVTSVRSIAAIFHQVNAMRADAREVWTTVDKKEREAKFAVYKRNVNRVNAARSKAINVSTNAVKFVYEYLTSDTMLNIPVGTSAEIAIVSPNSCIPSPEISKMRETLGAFTELLKTGTDILETDIDINELLKHKFFNEGSSN